MAKIYEITASRGSVEFEPYVGIFPRELLEKSYTHGVPGIEVAGRMGDPDLLYCIAYRRTETHGGFFVMFDRYGLLYGAIAQTNLDYAAALGYFGMITSNARYGADIYEELDDDV